MADLICVDDFQKHATSLMSQPVADYYNGGADDHATLEDNRTAFTRLVIRPNCMNDVSSCHLSTTLLGTEVSFPICVAPTAGHKILHPDGEVATSRACAKVGTIHTLPTISTTSMEEVAEKSPDSIKWFQTFIFKDKSKTVNLVKRAEMSGFSAIVISIDVPVHGNRVSAERNSFNFPAHLKMPHYDIEIKSNPMTAVTVTFNPSATWDDIVWLTTVTRLPIVLKGVLTKEDAIMAVKSGASAIIVSNHGGRQLNGSPATIEALPEIVRAVGNKCEVYMDGGIRTGTDVLKALALGARAVFVGRPVLWGLTVDGQSGVEKVLQILRNELDLALRLSGISDLSQLRKRSVVVLKSYYKSSL